MNSRLLKSLAAAAIFCTTLFSANTSQALTISLTPGSPLPLLSGTDPGQAAINTAIAAYASPATLIYNAQQNSNFSSSESGAADPFYTTTFSNADLADADARITWDGPSTIAGSPIYALIKDGNLGWYFYDISGWNGTDNIEFSGYYGGNQGRISHVSLYGGTLREGPPVGNVPEGGMTLTLLGLGLVGMGVIRRFIKKA
jgi:hypothetical protein